MFIHKPRILPLRSMYPHKIIMKYFMRGSVNRPIPLCGRRAMHAGSLVSKLGYIVMLRARNVCIRHL